MTSTDFTLPTEESHECPVSLPAASAVPFADWSPDELRVMVAQEEELRSIIVEYYRSQMIEKKHYYRLPGAQKPALSKEGALNLCSLFKVRVSIDALREHYHDDGHYSVRYRVFLINSRTGHSVADGDGYCTTRESRYAYRWMKMGDVPDTLDTATLMKRQTRTGSQVRVPTPDLADHYNTVLKMAYKRAIVAAALCLPLVSELFTQDIDERASTAPTPEGQSGGPSQRRQAPPNQAAATPPNPAPVTQLITPQQVQQLWSLIKQHEVDFEAFRTALMRLGLQSSKALSPTQLEACLNEIHTRKRHAFQSPTHGTRAQLFEALGMLQAVLSQAQTNQPPGDPHAQTLLDLAQWQPKVSRACEHPETPEDQLQTYLTEVHESLDQLQHLATVDIAT